MLLVSPAFHGYWRAISGELSARGHDVTTVRYDDHGGAFGRLRHKVAHELPDRLGQGAPATTASARMTDRAVRAVDARRPEVVVVVRGDLLGDAFWERLDDLRLPRVTWLYDEVRRLAYTPERLARLGPVCSYSAADTAALASSGIATRHLPLAHDARLPVRARRSDEVVFVGARYPVRERLLGDLARAGVPVRAYGRDWSGHVVDRARTWRLHGELVPSGRDLDRAEAYGAMAGGLATLNVHGDQDGFTMRTFEACGVGALQLIDRADVTDLYEPGAELLTFDGPGQAAELCRRAARDPAWAGAVRRAGERRTAAEHTFAHRVGVLESMWG